MPALASTSRDDRVDVRLSSDTKTLIARAAAYAGMSVSTFLVSVARERAKALVAEHETVMLSPRDWSAFLAAMDKPRRRRPKLAAAAKRYLKRRTDAR